MLLRDGQRQLGGERVNARLQLRGAPGVQYLLDAAGEGEQVCLLEAGGHGSPGLRASPRP